MSPPNVYTYTYLKEISNGLNFTDTNRPSRFCEGIIEVRNGVEVEETCDNDNIQRRISKIKKKVLNNSNTNMPPLLKTKVKDYITFFYYNFGYQLVKLEHRGTNPSWRKEEVKAIVLLPQPLADITNHYCTLPCNPNLPDKTVKKNKHSWTKEEHKLLLSAIQLYRTQTQWTKIAEVIKTKTCTQAQTYANKQISLKALRAAAKKVAKLKRAEKERGADRWVKNLLKEPPK